MLAVYKVNQLIPPTLCLEPAILATDDASAEFEGDAGSQTRPLPELKSYSLPLDDDDAMPSIIRFGPLVNPLGDQESKPGPGLGVGLTLRVAIPLIVRTGSVDGQKNELDPLMNRRTIANAHPRLLSSVIGGRNELGPPITRTLTLPLPHTGGRNDLVVTTATPVLTSDECRRCVEAAEARASELGGWTTNRHVDYATLDMPVHQIPKVAFLLLGFFHIHA